MYRLSAGRVLWSIQGLQFTFREFSSEWGFQHVMSSPQYPQSNGKAEAAASGQINEEFDWSWTGTQVDKTRLAHALL